MSANVYDTERHIYPRWRSFQATASLGEVARPATGRDVDTDALDESLAQGIADWEANPLTLVRSRTFLEPRSYPEEFKNSRRLLQRSEKIPSYLEARMTCLAIYTSQQTRNWSCRSVRPSESRTLVVKSGKAVGAYRLHPEMQLNG